MSSLIVGWENSGKTALIQHIFRPLFAKIKETYPTADHWFSPNRDNIISKLKRSAGAASTYLVDDLRPFQENLLRRDTRQSAADVFEDLFSDTSGKNEDSRDCTEVAFSFLATCTPPSACAFYRALHDEGEGMNKRMFLFSGPSQKTQIPPHPNGEAYVISILQSCLMQVIERHRTKRICYRLSKTARAVYAEFVQYYHNKTNGPPIEGDPLGELRRRNLSRYFALLVKKLVLSIYLTKQAMELVFFKRTLSENDWHYIPPEVITSAVAVFELSEDHWFNYLMTFVDDGKGPVINRGIKRTYEGDFQTEHHQLAIAYHQ